MSQHVREYYILTCVLTVTMIYVLILTGLSLSFRPGVPSISRMIVDQPLVLPLIYYVFLVISTQCRTAVINSFSVKGGGTDWWMFAVTLAEFIGFAMIPVCSMDFQPELHMFAAGLIVVASVPHQVVLNTHEIIVHRVLVALVTVVLSLTFLCVSSTVRNSETSTNVALAEYALFLVVGAKNMLNIFLV